MNPLDRLGLPKGKTICIAGLLICGSAVAIVYNPVLGVGILAYTIALAADPDG